MRSAPIGAAIALACTAALGLACRESKPEPAEASPAPAESVPAATAQPAATAEPSRFVGSQACGECHAAVVERWRGSHHARSVQQATPETVVGNFASAKVREGSITWHLERGDRFRVRSEGAHSQTYEVAYTIGVDPVQQYLVALPDGRLQPFHIAWDARPAPHKGQRWLPLAGEHGAPTGPDQWQHPSRSWNATCADCHSTGFEKRYDVDANRYDSRWAELGVGCEACHGGGARHVEWARAGARGADRGLDAPLTRPAKPAGSPSREVDTCAACHAQRGRIVELPRAGAPLLDGYEPALLDRELYHDDGQVGHESHEWGSFVQTAKYAAGVRCSDCHDPHTAALRASGNALCGTCHEPAKFDAPEHHHHPAASTPQCVDCHMTRHPFMSVDERRDHGFHVPRPDLTLAIGTPNACATCHAKRGDAWAAETVAAWRGGAPPRPHFAQRLHLRITGGSAAGEALASLAADATAPAIARATALLELATEPRRDLIDKASRSPEPLLRLAAARSAAGLVERERILSVGGLLADPLRAVRIEAANALASVPEAQLSDKQRADRSQALDEYRAALAVGGDTPANHANLAVLAQQQGDVAVAEAAYQQALRMDDTFVPAYTGLVDLYSSQKRDGDGATLLHRGIERAPESADLHFALGMLLSRQKQDKPALEEFAAAAKLEPEVPYFAYVYALALNEGGQTTRALAVLRPALARHPLDQNLLGAVAVIGRNAKRFDEALAAAKKLAELFPGQPEPAALVQDIENQRAGRPGVSTAEPELMGELPATPPETPPLTQPATEPQTP